MTEPDAPGGQESEETPDAGDLRELAQVFADVSIAPLGRNYFGRYREIRDALREAADSVPGGEGDAEDESDAGGDDGGPGEGDAGGEVDPEALRQHLDADDLEFMDAIVRNLRNFARDGIDRVGRVEPYVSAQADADRLEPLLDAFRPLLEG